MSHLEHGVQVAFCGQNEYYKNKHMMRAVWHKGLFAKMEKKKKKKIRNFML